MSIFDAASAHALRGLDPALLVRRPLPEQYPRPSYVDWKHHCPERDAWCTAVRNCQRIPSPDIMNIKEIVKGWIVSIQNSRKELKHRADGEPNIICNLPRRAALRRENHVPRGLAPPQLLRILIKIVLIQLVSPVSERLPHDGTNRSIVKMFVRTETFCYEISLPSARISSARFPPAYLACIVFAPPSEEEATVPMEPTMRVYFGLDPSFLDPDIERLTAFYLVFVDMRVVTGRGDLLPDIEAVKPIRGWGSEFSPCIDVAHTVNANVAKVSAPKCTALENLSWGQVGVEIGVVFTHIFHRFRSSVHGCRLLCSRGSQCCGTLSRESHLRAPFRYALQS
jgi:hypothetical protein